MTLIKAKKQRSKPQAPSNYKLRCTNDFVFKSLMTYDPEIGKRLVKDLTESIRDYVVDKVDLTSTELLTEGFQAKDIRRGRSSPRPCRCAAKSLPSGMR